MFFLVVRLCIALEARPIWIGLGLVPVLASIALVGFAGNRLEAAYLFTYSRALASIGYVVGVGVLCVVLYYRLRSLK